jgi:hypothetical protein
MIIRLQTPGGKEFEIVTNGHIEEVGRDEEVTDLPYRVQQAYFRAKYAHELDEEEYREQ